MKHLSFRLLLIVFTAAAIAACTGAPAKPAEAEFLATYPSQFIVGDTYILKDREQIKGNVVGIGTTLVIEDGAIIMGDVSLIGSSLELSGRIAGDINLLAGSSFIKDTAIVAGNINQIFQKTEVAQKALVTGGINTFTLPASPGVSAGNRITNLFEWLRPGRILVLQVLRVLGLLLVSLLGVYALRPATEKISSAIRSNAPAAWGAGLLSIISGPIIAVMLIITICLSPVGILLLLALIIGSLWGWVALSVLLGEKIAKWLKLDWDFIPATLIGTLLLGIFTALISLLPCIGFLINLMISATGIGGVLLSIFTANQK